jgi:hypothetical protein
VFRYFHHGREINVRVIRIFALAILVAATSAGGSFVRAQLLVSIHVNVEPPALPVYDQPLIPAPGYIWVPGYWAWSDDVGGYYWVPGTWILPPQVGLLWTPGYWGWSDGAYFFHPGYWGPEIGFYGGVNYGYGYTGVGYEGGYWRNGNFFYNRSVNNITNVAITNVYNKTVVVNNTSRVSFNGGPSGIQATPTPEQLAAEKQPHVVATPEQTRHVEAAAKDPSLALANNHGNPAIAATAHPAQFKGSGVVGAHPVNAVTPAQVSPLPAAQPKSNVLPPSAQKPLPPAHTLPSQASPPTTPPSAHPEKKAPLQVPPKTGPSSGNNPAASKPAVVAPPRAQGANAPHPVRPVGPSQPHASPASHPSNPAPHRAPQKCPPGQKC